MKTYYPHNVEDWHNWLLFHSEREKEIWLVFPKAGSGVPGISYEQAVEEAICFGWVDSLIKNLDETRYVRKFTPRRLGSPWSELNISRAQRMIYAGRMTEAGHRLFSESDQNRLQDCQTRKKQQEQWREELIGLLQPQVMEIFKTFPPSRQRQYAGWVMSAKKLETKLKRINELSDTLLKGEKLVLK